MALRRLEIATSAEAEQVLRDIGVDVAGIASMAPKMTHLNVRIPGVESRAANILKQDMLSIGGEAAVARGTVDCTVPETDVLLMGTEKQIQHAIEKFKKQPFGIKGIASRLEQLLSAVKRDDFILNRYLLER